MGRESPSTRCEQLAQQLLIFDRPLPPEEIVAKIEAVDVTAARRVLTNILSSRPTLACIGPVSRVEPYDRLAARLS
jgi:predicted Zn-dependent peptidase